MNIKQLANRNNPSRRVSDSKKINDSSLTRLEQWISGHNIAIMTAWRTMFMNQTNNTKEVMENNVVEVPDDFPIDDFDQQARYSQQWRKSHPNGEVFEGYVYSRKEKDERNRKLKSALLASGYGVTSVQGAFRVMGMDKESSENSFFIVNLNDDNGFFETCFGLSEYYNQDCFLYKGLNEDAINVGTNNSEYPSYGKEDVLGRFQPKVVNMFLSRIGNASFVFSNDSFERDDTNNSFLKRKMQRKNVSDGYGLTTLSTYIKLHGTLGGRAIFDSGKEVLNKCFNRKK